MVLIALPFFDVLVIFLSVHVLVFLLWIIWLVFPFVFPTLKFYIFSRFYVRMIFL